MRFDGNMISVSMLTYATPPVFAVVFLIVSNLVIWNDNTAEMQRTPRNVSVYRMRPVNYTKNLRDDFFSINTTHEWTYLDAQFAGVGCLGNYQETVALLKGEPSSPSYNININISITPSVGAMLLHSMSEENVMPHDTTPTVCACIQSISNLSKWEDVENETRICLAQNMNIYRVHAENTINAPVWLSISALLIAGGIILNFIEHYNYTAKDPKKIKWWATLLCALIIDIIIIIYFVMFVLPESSDEYNSPEGATYLELWMFFGIMACLVVWWVSLFVTETILNTANFHTFKEDVWFVLGFAVLGTSLKLSSGDQDEERLLAIFAIIVGIGALQHLSNVVKCWYETLSGNLQRELVVKLTGYVLKGDKAEQQKLMQYDQVVDSNVEKARSVLQFFGWTRLIVFALVVFFSLTLLTLSDASNLDMTAVQHFMEIHYNVFVIAFIVSIVGVDVFFETVPFMFKDQKHGHIRNMIIGSYALYVYFSIFMWSKTSGVPESVAP